MSRLSELIAEHCPDGVEYKRIDQVVTIRNGSDHKHLGDGEIPVYGSGGIMRYADTASCQGPSVLLPRKGSVDKVYYMDRPFWNVDTVFRTVIDESQVVPKFFYYLMVNAHLEQYSTSAARPSLTQRVLNKIVIPVPPIEVQYEVVRILDEYTTAHDELVRQLEEHAFCIEQAHAAYLQAAYDEAFRHCEHVPLGKHCNLINGDRGKNYPSRGNFVDEGAAFINAGHIQNGVLDFTDMNYITEENYSALRSGKVKSGDILYCLRGSLGKHCLISNVHGAIASSLVIIRCDREYYLPEFINYTLDMPFITDQMNSVSNGSAQPNLAGRSVAGYQVPLPTLKEQRAFISQLDRHAVGSFNELAAELRLQSRLYNQQLALVRNQLLSFPEKAA